MKPLVPVAVTVTVTVPQGRRAAGPVGAPGLGVLPVTSATMPGTQAGHVTVIHCIIAKDDSDPKLECWLISDIRVVMWTFELETQA